MGHGGNPPEKRLPKDLSLKKARYERDLKQEMKGTTWWNKDGAPKKAMQVWQSATENPGLSVAALARRAGVSRPTVYKWLKPGWESKYAAALRQAETDRLEPQPIRRRVIEEQAEQFKKRYADDRDGFERMVVRHVASHPWEPFDQTAAFFGLSGAAAIERIIADNKAELDRAKLGLEERRHAWDSETDDYFDAMTAARITGRFDEFMTASHVRYVRPDMCASEGCSGVNRLVEERAA